MAYPRMLDLCCRIRSGSRVARGIDAVCYLYWWGPHLPGMTDFRLFIRSGGNRCKKALRYRPPLTMRPAIDTTLWIVWPTDTSPSMTPGLATTSMAPRSVSTSSQ